MEGAQIRKDDVSVAKNYLDEKELKALNRIVTMCLDYAEDQAERNQLMYMRDWEDKLNFFLQFNGREVQDNPGKISNKIAKELASKEYEKFRLKRLHDDKEDDFERFLSGYEVAMKKLIH